MWRGCVGDASVTDVAQRQRDEGKSMTFSTCVCVSEREKKEIVWEEVGT